MRRLVYLKAARNDLADILRYVTAESGSLVTGQRFVGKLRAQCAKLAVLPGLLGRTRPELGDGIRSFPMRTYVIFFRYRVETLEVVNVLEAHRDVEGSTQSGQS